MSYERYEMSCERYQEMIALEVGGDLPASDTERLEQHLLSCDACRRFAAEMRDSQRAVSLLAGAPVDPEVLASIRAGVLREVERSGRHRSPIPFRLPPRVLALAAALAVALGALLLLRTGEPRTGKQEATGAPRVVEAVPAPEPPAAVSQPATTQPTTSQESIAEPVAAESVRAAPMDQPAPEPRPPVTVSHETRVAAAPIPPAPGTPAAEPMVIKLVSEEADLVIYWLVHPPAEATKEKTHEISAV